MKSVLISIRPEWCEKIINGQKTIEVRKTRPKIATPFKCYLYCTKPNTTNPHEYLEIHADDKIYKANGKVIGEFICDRIIEEVAVGYSKGYYEFDGKMGEIFHRSLLSPKNIREYLGYKKGYGWHISDLVIYDKPKDIRQFAIVDKEAVKMCPHRVRVGQSEAVTKHNGWIKGGYGCEKEHAWEVAYEYCDSCRCKPLNRPPQSWRYVQED